MLYISRRVAHIDKGYARIHYGVVDSDDGVETIVSIDELVKVIGDVGLVIEGVPDGEGCVFPYQHVDSLKPIQVKMKMLKDIDIVVWNNMITHIQWNLMSDGIRLRLSDFGDSCADFCVFDNPTPASPVTLVFDDKLKSVGDWAFRFDARATKLQSASSAKASFVNDSLRFDLLELSDNMIARSIYEQISFYTSSFDVIIDSVDRRTKMIHDIMSGGSRYALCKPPCNCG